MFKIYVTYLPSDFLYLLLYMYSAFSFLFFCFDEQFIYLS